MSTTRLLLASFVLGPSLLAVAVHFFPRPSRGTPSAAQTARCVAEPLQDLGHITAQKEWEIVFPIRNAGARRLVLNEQDPECNCGDRDRRMILVPPGATADVTVTLDTRFAAGPIESTVAFTTNDPARPSLNLTVRAWVDGPDVTGDSTRDDDIGVSILIRK